MRTSIAWLYEELRGLKQSDSVAYTVSNEQSSMPGTRGTSSDGSGRGDNVVTVSDGRTSSVQLEVHRVLHDAAKRKMNVVVTGLPETTGNVAGNATGADTVKEDSEAFIKFCEENLEVKPPLAHKGCMRLGKRVGDKPRKLLVQLTSESSAASLLSASRNMQRVESTKNFYINPDSSRAEAQLAFEQRQKRRAARKAIKRANVSATGNDDTDDGRVTGPTTGYTDDAAVRSNLSATMLSSIRHHPQILAP